MQNKILFIFSLLLIVVTSIPAVAEDLCASLDGRALTVNGNGYKGIAAPFSPGLSLSKEADGTYTFVTGIQFENEELDKLTGTCKDRHIIFKRTREGVFVQDYDGWIFERGGDLRGMAGTFAHNGVRKWSWCGQVVVAIPLIK